MRATALVSGPLQDRAPTLHGCSKDKMVGTATLSARWLPSLLALNLNTVAAKVDIYSVCTAPLKLQKGARHGSKESL